MNSVDPPGQFHTAKPNNKKGRCGRKPVACAECKRSKLKCEGGNYPCSACKKRGCEEICPHGTLNPTKSTTHLKDKNERLQSFLRKQRKREKELEAALRDAHGFLSSTPHPLLLPEGSPFNPSAINSDNAGDTGYTDPDIDGLLDSFGSLTIDNKGQTSYHGSSSTVEHMLRTIVPREVEESASPNSPVDSNVLPPYVVTLSNAFPYGTMVQNDARRDILDLLPDEETATILTDIYFGSASSIFPPVDESEFRASVLQEIYMYGKRKEVEKICYHKLSALFLVLGFGAYYKDVSMDIEIRREKADWYSQLSRAAMSIEGTVYKTNVWTVATFLILVQFSTSIEWRKSDERWTISGFIVHDSEAQNRRALYWESILVEHWIAIAYGRPSGFDVTFADCRFAHDMEPSFLESGESELGFKAYNHRIFAFFISRIVVHIFSTRPTNYSELLRIEQSFREFKCPRALCCPTTAFRQYYASVYFKECTLLYAHRRYVVRALKLNRSDPLQTKYHQSILGSLQSANILLGTLRSLLGVHMKIVSRVAFFWTSAFSALFVLGSLVYVSPHCGIVKEALEAFESGVQMFEAHREKDKLGQLSIDLLVKLRNHIRNLLVGMIRQGPSSVDSKTEVAITLIQLLEGGSGLVNTEKFFSLRGASPESEGSTDSSTAGSPTTDRQVPGIGVYTNEYGPYDSVELPITHYPTYVPDDQENTYMYTYVNVVYDQSQYYSPEYYSAPRWGAGWSETAASTQPMAEIPDVSPVVDNIAWQALYTEYYNQTTYVSA
ncbi:hypothetical protein PNOK_0488000 [Pyrrhoderma noxium]|uniref:Zn(2)-C6 fungal-type domain-containing protein n=1 Tax=Pyrrhoderma noxium TaxID=2282107 RepID=A0A286UK01_9AGAM|nr:hypothetical protein PNOK_0488000 [Pyrrhoderma noxium]